MRSGLKLLKKAAARYALACRENRPDKHDKPLASHLATNELRLSANESGTATGLFSLDGNMVLFLDSQTECPDVKYLVW